MNFDFNQIKNKNNRVKLGFNPKEEILRIVSLLFYKNNPTRKNQHADPNDFILTDDFHLKPADPDNIIALVGDLEEEINPNTLKIFLGKKKIVFDFPINFVFGDEDYFSYDTKVSPEIFKILDFISSQIHSIWMFYPGDIEESSRWRKNIFNGLFDGDWNKMTDYAKSISPYLKNLIDKTDDKHLIIREVLFDHNCKAIDGVARYGLAYLPIDWKLSSRRNIPAKLCYQMREIIKSKK